MKTCTKCGEVKALAAFSKDKGKKDGLHGVCKQCRSDAYAAYKKSNPEKFKALKSAWNKANPEKVKAHRVKYYKDNAGKIATRNAAYYKANAEKINHRVAANTDTERQRDYSAKRAAAMSGSYVRNALRIPAAASIAPELISLKREQLETYRLAKQLKQATKDEHASI